MERKDNYLIQASHAKQGFLGLDQEALIQKLHLSFDDDFLYVSFVGSLYRIHRRTADISRKLGNGWADGNSYEETMTLLDLICDSREDRYLSHRFQNMQDFGHGVHRSLLEDPADPWARLFESRVSDFRRACLSLGGAPFPQGDAAYAIPVFDGLNIVVQLWLGDEEFPSQVRILWDENANMYLKYETMYFAKALVLRRIQENME